MYINAFKLVEKNNNWIIPKDIIEYMIIKSQKYRSPYLEIFEIRHKRKFLFITYYKKICFFISDKDKLQENLNSIMKLAMRDIKLNYII